MRGFAYVYVILGAAARGWGTLLPTDGRNGTERNGTGLSPGGVQDDKEGYVRGARSGDELADVGRDVGRQGSRPSHPEAAPPLDGEAAVQPHLS